MFNTAIHETLVRIVEPVAKTMGLDLWGVEIIHGGRSIVRIYVDGPDGVTVEQCAEISRHTGLSLEVEDVFSQPYVLEVSSPGLGRAFFSAAQMTEYLGQDVEISLFESPQEPADGTLFAGRKRFKGKLLAVEGEQLTIAPESVVLSRPADPATAPESSLESVPEKSTQPVLSVSWDAVRKAVLIPVFPEKGQKKSLSPKSAKAVAPEATNEP